MPAGSGARLTAPRTPRAASPSGHKPEPLGAGSSWAELGALARGAPVHSAFPLCRILGSSSCEGAFPRGSQPVRRVRRPSGSGRRAAMAPGGSALAVASEASEPEPVRGRVKGGRQASRCRRERDATARPALPRLGVARIPQRAWSTRYRSRVEARWPVS